MCGRGGRCPLNTCADEKPDQSTSRRLSVRATLDRVRSFVTVLHIISDDINLSFHIWKDNWLFLSSWLFTFYTERPGLCFQASNMAFYFSLQSNPVLFYFFFFFFGCEWVPECLQEVSVLNDAKLVKKTKQTNVTNVARTHLLCSKAATTPSYLLHTRAICHCEAAPGIFRGLGCVRVQVSPCLAYAECRNECILRGVCVSLCRMSAWVHAYVLAYHKICKNNAITLTVQQFPSELQLYKNLR